MNEFDGTASTTIRADAHAVFRLITDIGRLPEWNAAVEQILELPFDISPIWAAEGSAAGAGAGAFAVSEDFVRGYLVVTGCGP